MSSRSFFSRNGFPAGTRELVVGNDLATIQLVRQGEQARVQNFSLVRTIGCLTRSENDAWVLGRSSEPVATTDDAPKQGELASAASQALGSGSFVLLSVGRFNPATSQGQKVEARGLIYRENERSLLTVTSLRAVGRCES
jgi:hypothetical protein